MIIGASLYLKTYDEKYLKKLEKAGYNSLFTSLHIPEDDFDEKKLKNIINFSKNSSVNLMVDVSPETLNKLKVKDILELKNYNIKSIRLDYGFDDVKYVKKLSENFEIVLNASILSSQFIVKLIDTGVDALKIKALHNFYPKINTGLDESKFIELNSMLNSYGIDVYAFIAGDTVYRYPTYEGLVTLEKHRGTAPYPAAVEFYKKHNVQGIFVGDGTMSDQAINSIANIKSVQECIEIRCMLEKEYDYLYDQKLGKRKDSNLKMTRLLTRSDENVEQNNCLKRNIGNISITNTLYSRYANEIEISNSNLGFDRRFNTIGYILDCDLELLNLLDGTKYVIFRR